MWPFQRSSPARRAGWRVVELDVSYRERAKGTSSKVSGSVRGTLRATRDLAKAWRR
jgi:hypothetical protein